jgi:hypothetical protein
MIVFVTAFGGAWLATAWLLATILPRPSSRSTWFLAGSMGLGLSYGWLSLACFAWRLLFVATGPAYFVCEAGLIAGVGCIAWWRQRRQVPPAPSAGAATQNRVHPTPPLWLAGGLGLLAVAAIVSFVFQTLWLPLGCDDALAIWNLKARFLFHVQDDNAWLLQSLRESTGHGGYPLLVPLTVARCWSALRQESVWVPAWVAFSFTAGAVAMAAAVVASLRGARQGLLAGLTLAGSSLLIKHGASQYADVPVAYFVLMALALLAMYFETGQSSRALLILAGVAAGLCAWTKNEGLLLTAAVPVAHFLGTRGKTSLPTYARQMCWLATGLLPILSVVAYFKLVLGATDDLIAAQGVGTWQRLTDAARAWQITQAYVQHTWYVTKAFVLVLPVYWLLVGGRRRQGTSTPAVRCGVLAVILMLGGFFFVYMTTPHPLGWHLGSSLSRLMLQLWPATATLFFLTVAVPGEPAGDHRPTTLAGPQHGSQRARPQHVAKSETFTWA